MPVTYPFENLISSVWAKQGVRPEFVQILLAATSPQQITHSAGPNSPALWASRLPGLCCAALGGTAASADNVAGAWYLFYISAHILDNVEDEDSPEPWWEELGPGPAVNVATGLLFTASLILAELQGETPAAGEISREFYRRMLAISEAQHLDLTLNELTVRQWWRIAEAKSGTAFSLGCWAGARLASGDQSLLDFVHLYGFHLGLLIQVLDDARDFLAEGPFTRSAGGRRLGWSLPVVYAMEVLPTKPRSRLEKLLENYGSEEGDAEELIALIRGAGADLYLRTQLRQHSLAAQNAILAAAQPSAARDKLVDFVVRLIEQ